jgi:hypothetical protein
MTNGVGAVAQCGQEVGGRKIPDIKLRSAEDGKSILSRFRFGPQSFSTSVLSTQMLVYRKSELQDHPIFIPSEAI